MSSSKNTFTTLVVLGLTVITTILSKRTEFIEIVETLNGTPSTMWVAGLSPDIDYDNEEGLIKMTSGSLLETPPAQKVTGRPRMLQTAMAASLTATATAAATVAYPASLDLRTKYPKCSSIRTIRSQGICSSCWAFSAMNSISDRYCIKTGSERFFAPQDSLECCPNCYNLKPCNGGYLYQAFLNAKTVGVVTGDGISNSNGLCKPYFLDSNFIGALVNPKCSTTCNQATNTAAKNYNNDKVKISDFTYGLGVTNMVKALNEGGSIAVSFNVYTDLLTYKSGIYSKVMGASQGAHAVRIVGYGTENGVDYWVVANSWGSNWGENGYFRIRKGKNECNIESNYFFGATI